MSIQLLFLNSITTLYFSNKYPQDEVMKLVKNILLHDPVKFKTIVQSKNISNDSTLDH